MLSSWACRRKSRTFAKNSSKTKDEKPSKTIKSLSPPTLWIPSVVLKGVAYNMLSKNLEGRFDLSPILDFGSLERPGNGWPLHVINIHKQVVHTDVHKIELYIVH